jgi:uncharacterized membrane-anchored protein
MALLAAPAIDWQAGPLFLSLGAQARLALPAGHIAASGAEAAKFLDATGNPPTGKELAVVGIRSLDWFAVFSYDTFETLGFVRSASKGTPDVDAIIRALREGNEAANRARAAAGRETLDLLGWRMPPRYDPETQSLSWAIDSRESGGRDVANTFVFFLTNQGVITAELVTEAKDTAQAGVAFRSLLKGFSVNPAARYDPPFSTSFTINAVLAAIVVLAALWIFLRRVQSED